MNVFTYVFTYILFNKLTQAAFNTDIENWSNYIYNVCGLYIMFKITVPMLTTIICISMMIIDKQTFSKFIILFMNLLESY